MTATLVLPHGAPESDWLAARRKGIGASEIAAVMGISPYDSPFSLWWRKHNGWDADVNDEMRVGKFLEPTVADWFAEFGDPNENLTFTPAGLYAHPDRPWQMATPDRLIYMDVACDTCSGGTLNINDDYCPDCFGGCNARLVALLECKWVAASWDGWGAEGTDEVPVHYRAQCLWQMDVMGVDEVFLCVLGPGGFRVYRIRRDERDLVAMREAGRRFMESLANGNVPDVDDHAATLPILRRLHADIEDREQEIPADIAEGWLRAKDFAAKAKRVEAKYGAKLRAHLGTASKATLGGEVFAARTAADQLRRKS